MKKTLIALGIFSLLGALAYAADNYEYLCGTIMEIYGVCSPELIQNWIAQTSHITPQVSTPANPPEETPINHPTINTSLSGGQNATTVYCWYMIDGTKKCRLNRMFWTEDRIESKCNGSFNLQGKELCDLTK